MLRNGRAKPVQLLQKQEGRVDPLRQHAESKQLALIQLSLIHKAAVVHGLPDTMDSGLGTVSLNLRQVLHEIKHSVLHCAVDFGRVGKFLK